MKKISENSHIIMNDEVFFFEFQYQCEREYFVVFVIFVGKEGI